MEEIEVGEYVRTETGHVGRLNKVSAYKINNKDKTMYLCKFKYRVYPILKSDITKHSKNIIDLIEVGDFVNGFPVLEPIYNGNVWNGIDEGYEHFKRAYGDIKEILTHEQYENNCYRLEDIWKKLKLENM